MDMHEQHRCSRQPYDLACCNAIFLWSTPLSKTCKEPHVEIEEETTRSEGADPAGDLFFDLSRFYCLFCSALFRPTLLPWGQDDDIVTPCWPVSWYSCMVAFILVL